ncbi:hypothetical protein DPEC_G00028670 [Dallia pectoralis]|uniref:Uncharacterized protein n=1 Tax=Dallia pectoralis TaxID=75939 RepID=A0ACC2HI51_DALPE|nr:hypothetical protein DPEC_G00028670 [Dallia pectoralis]
MHKHHHCCKCPECYEVTRMAALRRMDAPQYQEWQAEPYGYPAGYGPGGGQTLPQPPASGGGGGGGGGGGTLGRSKGKMMSAGGPGGPNPKTQSKGGPKVNGNNSGGQAGWWPECTCSNREWYDQKPSTGMYRSPVPLSPDHISMGGNVPSSVRSRVWSSTGGVIWAVTYGHTAPLLECPLGD